MKFFLFMSIAMFAMMCFIGIQSCGKNETKSFELTFENGQKDTVIIRDTYIDAFIMKGDFYQCPGHSTASFVRSFKELK